MRPRQGLPFPPAGTHGPSSLLWPSLGLSWAKERTLRPVVCHLIPLGLPGGGAGALDGADCEVLWVGP